MYKREREEPRKKPWGTLELIGHPSEDFPSRTVKCCLLPRNGVIKLKTRIKIL